MGKKDEKRRSSGSSGRDKKREKSKPSKKKRAEQDMTTDPHDEAEEVEAEPFDASRDPGPTYEANAKDRDASATLGENLWPTLCHLSPLIGWIVALSGPGMLLMPFLWIAAPLVLWQTRKSDARVQEHGREVLNFQLNVVALSTMLIATCVLSPFGLLLPVVAIGLSLFAALQASEGRTYRYPFIYRIIRE